MSNSTYDVAPDTIFVRGLPEDTKEDELEQFFGQIGIIKMDRKNNCKKIWIYKDKASGKGKGEATITYDDPPAATSAINWFNGKEFRGCKLNVELAQRKSQPKRPGGDGGFRGARNSGPVGRPGDWLCNSCSNKNFAYRQECNRCRAPKPQTRDSSHPYSREVSRHRDTRHRDNRQWR